MPSLVNVIRKICLTLPDTEEVESHGSPEFKVRGKSFASLSINHHGDMRVALLVNASPETQTFLVESAPKVFFVPPYVGGRGWVGIDLGSGVRWPRVAELACDGYKRVAPASLAARATPPKKVTAPDSVDVRKLDPLFFIENQKLLEKLRKVCLALPETSEGQSFGNPVFKAGKKTFCQFSAYKNLPCAYFWVGTEQQPFLTADQRYAIPPYMGHNGWIQLRLDRQFDESEIARLALASYRHFALQRMLKTL